MDCDGLEELLDQLNLQLDNADSFSGDLSTQSTQDEPNRLFHKGKEYLEVSNLARPIRKSTAKSTSPVWKLGVELEQVDNGARCWQCLICKKTDKVTIYTAAATSGAKRHLEDDHDIRIKDKRFILLNKQNQAAPED